MLKFAPRSRSLDAPVRRDPQPEKPPNHDRINNPKPPSQAKFGLAGGTVSTTNLAIANNSARDITLVLGLDR
jgi:hypothetical protein